MSLRPLFLLLFLAVSACGGGSERTPVRTVEGPRRRHWQFPSRSELAAIGPAALRPEARRFGDREGAGWQIDDASLPGAADAALLARRVEALGGEGRHFTPSPALACAARELARFRLAKGASPAEGLRRHLLAHCGSTLTTASYGFAQGDSAANVGDDAVWRDALPKLREGLANVAADAQVGVAFVRAGDRVVVSTLAGAPAIEIEPSGRAGEAGEAGEVGEADTSFAAPSRRAIGRRGSSWACARPSNPVSKSGRAWWFVAPALGLATPRRWRWALRRRPATTASFRAGSSRGSMRYGAKAGCFRSRWQRGRGRATRASPARC
ncbi:MAG: hypothetical protein MUF34_26155 [Polyangiaceae bacterium]|nr:hypothetical protein [Polyangiaceae bacterium]